MGIAALRDATPDEQVIFGCNVIATALVPDGALALAGAFAPCGVLSIEGADMRKRSRTEVATVARALKARGAAYSATLSFNPDWDGGREGEEDEEDEAVDSN